MPPRVAVTAGEPAGVGPELLAALAAEPWDAQLVAVGSAALLLERARAIGVGLHVVPFDPRAPRRAHQPGLLPVLDVPLATPARAGKVDPRNAGHVLALLGAAADGAADGTFDAVATAPVHKGVINDAGTAFSGHTEFFAARAAADVLMLLAAPGLRVALATTHLPLRAVADAVTAPVVERALRLLHAGLRRDFGIARPRIGVLGLNPHAGEGGHLGREEIDVIAPVLDRLRGEGLDLDGPLPADIAFVPERIARCDTYLAMYHDQGLPVLKARGFGEAVNVTLGLPWIRTSVDHGTALDLAGSGRADPSSLRAALRLAVELGARRQGAAA
ncbi:MAG: 4-hydroxythreonine-4-phosphate dehydrogenase PdxA [Xanthomonadaceae bacterium]|jgi:4-hydroxythreonine-4-phosphate dehydrogenase|nr:4-hydroxythreonine-4-phosphate dehydrogenase PdxA [Xanthomonadaceae bacterium]